MKPAELFTSRRSIGLFIAVAVISAILSILYTDIFGKKGSGLGREFHYSIEDLRKTDPHLILYEETKVRFDVGFTQAKALAVGPDDTIYVIGNQAVYAFNPESKRLPLNIETNRELTAIAVSNNGSIYLGVVDHIEIYDPTGQLIEKWNQIDSKTIITSIALYKDNVFATDFGPREVRHFDSAGKLKSSFGDFIIPSPYFDVAISQDGQIYVANTGEHRIEVWSPEGNQISWWGEYSGVDPKKFCGCCNPVNFALLPDGKGFVTCEKGLTRIKVYDPEGAFIGFVAGPESFAQHDSLCDAPDYDINHSGLDVAVDSTSRILTLDPALGEVRTFKRKEDNATK